ncbi:hypothetical protein CONCODRAFT_80379 [Conidiobolus coronatus NRRL 28638]|uniref:Uncharacterized protein n=1 Tax=Conidiobolus coronatus (strain ATCC 28846 / CBS 209.66 / NRRL 28638) TaxID=796925 RepID=A0A137NVY4_CONC2|nr:hypothetical protein CONCODRAFT_80379 [Conidiobolus coronatus NRRL 28638]|eukprot:KXN66838.1 hypothetical protein CONCODRAFT_80379 [Conidiobolus coronatus NRRL 28638]
MKLNFIILNFLLSSVMSSNAEDYQNLVGKKFIESSNESSFSKSDSNLVFESELPTNRRIKKPGYGHTCDFDEDRLEITIDKEGIVKGVRNG